jgi:hypothetical protein
VGPRAALGAVEKRKVSWHCRHCTPVLADSACTVATILVCVEVINTSWSMFSGPMVWFVHKIQRVALGHGQLKSAGNSEFDSFKGP